WVEFTPFEYGMAKYGVFGKIEEFGGKFYKGQLVKKFEEPPLSYLQGIWGSVFAIILAAKYEKVALEAAGQCKTEDDDSEDEKDGVLEDEVDGMKCLCYTRKNALLRTSSNNLSTGCVRIACSQFVDKLSTAW
ncbi:cytosolic phospholipase A2-like, partial [Paramuricea clavata]